MIFQICVAEINVLFKIFNFYFSLILKKKKFEYLKQSCNGGDSNPLLSTSVSESIPVLPKSVTVPLCFHRFLWSIITTTIYLLKTVVFYLSTAFYLFCNTKNISSISGKILLFYLIFYSVLIGFFAAMLAVFYQTLDMKKPKWQLSSSLIGDNPGQLEILYFLFKWIHFM